MAKNIEIIKNRSDIGAGTRGSDLGIDAIEIAAINKGSDFFVRYPHKDVKTRNDIVYSNLNQPFAKYIEQIYMQCQEVLENVKTTLIEDKFPLVFSGDHSSAIGTISGIKAAYPDKKLGVIWIDAHADIHSPYTTPSGNMHGMPLAALMHLDNLDSAINDLGDNTKLYWNKLKNLGSIEPKITPNHLIYFGVRDVEEQEIKILDDLNIKNFTVDETRKNGIIKSVELALNQLEDCDIIYISFDVDSMDSELISDGTGTPVPKGFNVDEIKLLLHELFKSPKICCLEIVEVNPLLDHKGNKMAEVTFSILEDTF
jgi:arginase